MISLLIAGAGVAFVLSLAISKTGTGQTLRRWAGVLFLLALAPALFRGLVGAMGGTVASPHVAGGGVGDLLDCDSGGGTTVPTSPCTSLP